MCGDMTERLLTVTSWLIFQLTGLPPACCRMRKWRKTEAPVLCMWDCSPKSRPLRLGASTCKAAHNRLAYVKAKNVNKMPHCVYNSSLARLGRGHVNDSLRTTLSLDPDCKRQEPRIGLRTLCLGWKNDSPG